MLYDEEKDFYVALGGNLSALRAEFGYTQAQFARALNTPVSTYAGYESGVRKTPVIVLVKIANTLNVSMDRLILGENNHKDN
ncbi:MAG: helix-turn-helix transcriptional regulator [Clostridiales bacterium]|jgi:transcriptional regulator with XRE-family HTH domain|nr:helix-turn-helix transcriptional regulator [Clostridiales bacterium]